KGYIETDRQCRNIVNDVKNGIFKPVYLLMGEEPYYPDMVCNAIVDNCLQEWEKDFNETICYGTDVDVETVISEARRFPMMAERQLVVLKEAQAMKGLEDLSIYCQNPLDSTVLVIFMRGASADKRKSLYKSVLKVGTIVESLPLRDYEVSRWIGDFFTENGLSITPDAAAIMGEFAGTDLSKIALETSKMMKSLPEGTKNVKVEDVEKNIGVSRQFSIFELTKELSYRNAAKALRVAAYIGEAPRFAMPMAVSMLFTHFSRILRYEALLQSDPNPANDKKARVLGVNPYFFREYDAAVANYPLKKCMAIISLLCDYDYKGKGGEAGEATPSQLLLELVSKIINI
ncbi:MAG: DNA polymerase III subunit delta, partial [Bacteroidales bacterium]|nr:DNA polymerase III subunit delta [Bacteroidales bacterium]